MRLVETLAATLKTEAIRRNRRPEPIAKQMPRPRVHANSRSPRGSPRSSITPEGSGKGIGGKGRGQGDAMELADDPRLRDHTTGDEEPSDQEVSAHNEDKGAMFYLSLMMRSWKMILRLFTRDFVCEILSCG